MGYIEDHHDDEFVEAQLNKKTKFTVHKRTFEAKNFPVGSDERKKLNEDVVTSEYMTSHKYAVKGQKVSTSYRTKAEADDIAERWNKE